MPQATQESIAKKKDPIVRTTRVLQELCAKMNQDTITSLACVVLDIQE